MASTLDQLQTEAADIKSGIESSKQKLNIDSKISQQAKFEQQAASPDFWNDSDNAQVISKKLAKITKQTAPWVELTSLTNDLIELIAMGDESLAPQLQTQLDEVRVKQESLKELLKFNGRYDDYDAILNIYAGAGGTDAQDWADMLYRMYVRWCESSGFKVRLLDESRGDEAGLKSISIEVSGEDYVYGKLTAEAGVHRLVRLSPFNSDSLRQTSFAKVDVLPLIDSPTDVEIDMDDVKIDVYRSGGKGGQSVNTTDSAVRVTHLPTGITIAIQNERSQIQNKNTALSILRSRLAQLQLEQHADKLSDLKGPSQANEWGSQIRNYVLHPYKLVKDLRTGHESSDPDKVLDGGQVLTDFIDAYLNQNIS